MTLLPRGFDDILLDNLVTILADYSEAQVSLGGIGVGFGVERDRMTAPSAYELECRPLVSIYATLTNPAQSGSRDHNQSTCTIQIDCYIAELEDLFGGGDKAAMARLYYLKDQVRDALFAKDKTDLGFPVGTIANRKWGRFQITPQPVGSEVWICGGSWTFEVDYEFIPSDLTMVDLATVSIDVNKEVSQDPYSTRWAGLYTIIGG